ncbi:MAG TPA: ATP-binding protein, partial [Solirubrobacteraceae bacterium]|nr:ATP-binding protein [Solirubrobacteraceae bacterium]
AELVPTLFERFVRGAGDRGGSFGLGLAIVKAVAEAHGGSVALDGTGADGRTGARFVVRLPGEPSEAPGTGNAQTGDSAPAGWPISDRSLAT